MADIGLVCLGRRAPVLSAVRGVTGIAARTDVPDIFDEVDQDLRAERAQKLLQRYGGVLIAAAVLVIVAVGAFQARKWYDAKQAAQVADEYLAAMRSADGPPGEARQKAAADFAKVATQGRAGYRTVARLREAALKADTGDLPAALAIWDQVANDPGADQLLRDLASLEWATHQIDSGDPAAIEARLKPLTAPDNAWHALAEEAQALLALRQGRNEMARDTLRRLAQDVTAPDGVRSRANGLLARLGG
jgi:hypothetical protein